MNWNRGLFRTWVVLSAIWVVYVAGDAWVDWQAQHTFDSSTARPLSAGEAKVDTNSSFSFWGYAQNALEPPVCLLLVGLAGIWVTRGFKRISN